jgi:hypothetical protein
VKYTKAPPGWSYTDRNPFTQDGSYGSEWSSFCLLDREDDQVFTGQSGNGPFSARFGQCVENLEDRLIDFLRYENAHNRTVILSFPEGIDIDDFVARALSQTPMANVVRPNDPEVVVHSTTIHAWKSILADGELRAASCLGIERDQAHDAQESSEIDQYYQSEPSEYVDYIMLGEMDSTASEMVLASNSAGRFVLNDDAVYEPGARLYFDNHRIITDRLGTRDGLHVMKVHLRLPLTPYLLAAITVDDIDPEGKIAMWTLKTFVEKANLVYSMPRINFRRSGKHLCV